MKISVIIPVYNTNPSALRRAVDSVLTQEFPAFELILVDDKSPSIDTQKVLAEYAQVPGINVLHNKENLGVAGSRNQGILHAKGDWLAFLDHDDYYRPAFLKSLADQVSDDTDIVIGGYRNMDNNGEEHSLFPADAAEFRCEDYIVRNGMVWSRLFRKEALLTHRILFPEGKLMEDTIFCLRCAPLLSRMKTVPSWEYCYSYDNSSSITHSSKMRALPLEQLPIQELQEIAKQGLYNISVYYRISFLNALVNCSLYLTTWSKAPVRQSVVHSAGKILRLMNLSCSDLNAALRASDNSTFGRLILKGLWFSSSCYTEQLYSSMVLPFLRHLS